jgi:hypothetical protein
MQTGRQTTFPIRLQAEDKRLFKQAARAAGFSLAEFIPKSEIETGNLPQSLGQKRIEKISTDHFGYASIFSIRFCSKILRHLAGLNFGIRVKKQLSRKHARQG